MSPSAMPTTRPVIVSPHAFEMPRNRVKTSQERSKEMDNTNATFQEFRAYWQLSEELIANASKNDLAEVARILALQAAQYARKYGELQLPDLAGLLTASSLDEQSVGLLRDGTEALVGVLGIVAGGELDEDEGMMQ